MKKVLLAIALIIFVGCGYKPSAHYVKNVFTDSVYVDVQVDRVEPENAPYVRDELHRVIISRFGGQIVPKEQAGTIIVASYDGTEFDSIAFDQNGYVTRYRAKVRINFTITSKGKTYKRKMAGYVEEDITASSTLSSTLRILAIRKGMEKALDQFVAYVSTQGVLQAEEDAKQSSIE